jgi:hypothetical protein
VYPLTTVFFFVDGGFPGCDDGYTANQSSVEGTLLYEGIIDGVQVTHQSKEFDASSNNSTDIYLKCMSQHEVADRFSNSEWSASNRAPFMVQLTFAENSPLVLGSPLTPATADGSYIGPRGLQAVFRGPDHDMEGPMFIPNEEEPEKSYELVLFAMIVDASSPTPVLLPGSGGARRTCVPLTVRRVVTAESLKNDAQQYVVRRTDPVNCATMSADSKSIDSSIFKSGGCCYDDQSLAWPNSEPTLMSPINHGQDINAQCQNRRDVGLVSNLRSYSRWFWALSWGSESADGRILMMDPSVMAQQTTGTGITNDVRTQLQESPSWIGAGPPPLGSLPSCSSSSEVASCRIAIDQTGFVPCTGSQTNTWFSCMNPLMTNYFPQYSSEMPSEASTPFLRSMTLYTTHKTLNDLTTDLGDKPIGEWFRWQQYATMNHYCGTWMTDTSVAADPMSGYRPGKFMACSNDPMTPAERKNFCKTVKPWWVLTGNVLVTLSLEDICPFILETSGGDSPYCVVFADHPQYPTVRALLSANLPQGLTWNGVKFYYAPFTMNILRYILMNPSAINTLFTNSVDAGTGDDDELLGPLAGKPIPITKHNADKFSPSISYFARELVRMDESILAPVCNDDEIIPLDTFRAMYTLIQGYAPQQSSDNSPPNNRPLTPPASQVLRRH